MTALDNEVYPQRAIAEMFEWQSEQRYRLRTGRRAFADSGRRDDGVGPSTNRRAHLAGGSVVSLSLDGIQIGRG